MRNPDSPDLHPILESPEGFTEAERLRWVEMMLAMLWDQVWWMDLEKTDPERYKEYKEQGFKSPIEKFYGFDIIKAFRGD